MIKEEQKDKNQNRMRELKKQWEGIVQVVGRCKRFKHKAQ
jgi:hypothetical protein